MNRTIAIIPARGGSKRLPNKNMVILGDNPLLQYSINYANKHSDIIDKIVVSTDEQTIKELAYKNNIEVIDRPDELSGDLSPTVDTLRHVLENVDQHFDNVVLLQPTNPLRPKWLLNKAFKRFTEGDFDSLMTVTRNNDKLGRIKDNSFEPYNYNMGQRSQDIAPLYFENGLLYITKSYLITENRILGNKNLPYIIDHPYAKVDIDTSEDLAYAHFILEKYSNE